MKTNEERIEMLKANLKPLYENLLGQENIKKCDYPKVTFCMQWGENFPFEERSGIMFVGRSTNSWLTTCEDVNVLFGNTEDSIFNCPDQMKWVEDLWDNKKKGDYNTARSAFWRVIKAVTKTFHPGTWYSHVAWSNVYKISPDSGGNPNNKLCNAQLEDCKKILETEIKTLSPKTVVMFTGEYWSMPFLRYLNGESEVTSICTESWDGYECKVYQIGGTTFIVTEHPQGKKENSHKQALIKLLNKFK